MKLFSFFAIALGATLATFGAKAETLPQSVEVSGVIDTSASDLWNTLTTSEGLASFFMPGAYIEPRIGGLFELYAVPDNPPGQRGIEGQHILALEPNRRLMYTWVLPGFASSKVGEQHVIAEITLEPTSDTRTKVSFRMLGLGTHAGWERVGDYFTMRWRGVLKNLQIRFRDGDLDWQEARKRFDADTASFYSPERSGK